jgi:hypothetical protein
MAQEKFIQAKPEGYRKYLEKTKETHLFYLLGSSGSWIAGAHHHSPQSPYTCPD